MTAQIQDVIGTHPSVPFTAATVTERGMTPDLALIAVHLTLKADLPDAGCM